VRKWLRSYEAQKLDGLQELSRAPHSCPHKISGEWAERVIALRRRRRTSGAQRLKRAWDLPLSHMAIQRIWLQQGSPGYSPLLKARSLPAIQYTAREAHNGLRFLAYASRRSARASELFAQRIQRHLQSCGVRLHYFTYQTDNGSEFIGELQPDGSRSHFPRAVTYFGSQHERIPPRCSYLSERRRDCPSPDRRRVLRPGKVSRSRRLPRQGLPLPALLQLGPAQLSQGRSYPLADRPPARSPPPPAVCLLPPVYLDYPLDSPGGYDLPRFP